MSNTETLHRDFNNIPYVKDEIKHYSKPHSKLTVLKYADLNVSILLFSLGGDIDECALTTPKILLRFPVQLLDGPENKF